MSGVHQSRVRPRKYTTGTFFINRSTFLRGPTTADNKTSERFVRPSGGLGVKRGPIADRRRRRRPLRIILYTVAAALSMISYLSRIYVDNVVIVNNNIFHPDKTKSPCYRQDVIPLTPFLCAPRHAETLRSLRLERL